MKELVLKKCMKCNALVKVLEDCKDESCGIVCCGEPMKEVKANSTDAAFEKHVPTYEKEGENVHESKKDQRIIISSSNDRLCGSCTGCSSR